jgi:acyl-CoA hydrolase
MAAIRRFVAINSAVEVDLFGQVNADAVNGRLAAGVGGLPAFAAGAALSEGGRSIIALPAATDDGRFGRIVARLSAPGVCAIPRHHADVVVTEHGVAELRGLDLHARARALIAVAAPAMRDNLSAAWAELSRGL